MPSRSLPGSPCASVLAAVVVCAAYARAAASPVVHAWGPYKVQVDELPDGEQRARILDGSRVLDEIVDARIEVSFWEVTGSGDRELRIVHDPRGSCCTGIERWFTRDSGFQPMFSIDRGHGEGFVEVRDLDGDGRPELVFAITVWASEFIECASNPECRLDRVAIVGWDGDRYRDRTRAFPEVSRRLADEIWADHRWRLQHQVAGFYGNALLAGDEPSALRWIAHRLSGSRTDASWFARKRREIRREFLRPQIR